MLKSLSALLLIAGLLIMAAGCETDAGEGLYEETFANNAPRSEKISVAVDDSVTGVEFIISAKLGKGSVSAYIYDPEDTRTVLVLGLTDSTRRLHFPEPVSGQWRLELHIDGDSKDLVSGSIWLGWCAQHPLSDQKD